MYKTILIDDEKIVIEGLRKLVQWGKFGFELIGCYTDGIEGAEKIRQLKPDVVISDIRMPGIDGFSMIEQVKEALPYTVFLIISGYTDFKYTRKAFNLGVVDYIDKPITIEKVTEVLKRIRGICEENVVKRENMKLLDNINKLHQEPIFENLNNMIDAQGKDIYKPIIKITEYLQHNFHKDISLSEVARNAGFNPAYLSILFKEEMGIGFVKYLTSLRLDYAKKMLEEGYRVVEVSKKSGYNNYRYFCDTFKKYNGITPYEYKCHGSPGKYTKEI